MKNRYVEDGIAAVESGDTLMGLHCFEQIPEKQMSALEISYYAYCLVTERRAVDQALVLIKKALASDRNHPLVYLNLGRIYQVSGQTGKAAESFRRGARIQSNPLLLRALNGVNPRRKPIFPFLKRENPLNIICGRLLMKLTG
jgi:tetratricopeptide (TPR) repeat protein